MTPCEKALLKETAWALEFLLGHLGFAARAAELRQKLARLKAEEDDARAIEEVRREL